MLLYNFLTLDYITYHCVINANMQSKTYNIYLLFSLWKQSAKNGLHCTIIILLN